jgi:predicted DNA binding CopG/RHH family protein
MELAIGAKESGSMSEKIRYTDEPLGDIEVVPDFLPRPEDLVFRDEGVKVTIALSKRSVEFFKNEARKHNTQYQRMIRRLLDAYAEHHAKRPLTAYMDSRRLRKGSGRRGSSEV